MFQLDNTHQQDNIAHSIGDENDPCNTPTSIEDEGERGSVILDHKDPLPAKGKINPCKNWSFTWFDFESVPAFDILGAFAKSKCSHMFAQEEICPKSGKRHIQGCLELKVKARWSKDWINPTIHWEKTRNLIAARNYCQKDATRALDGKRFVFPVTRELKLIQGLRPWQKTVSDMCSEEPDDRTVNWIYDADGSAGKTVFTKYMVSKHDAIVATGGGAKDIACLIAILQKAGRDLNLETTFIFNFPRSSEGVSYRAIESVKDGLMTSAKYESSTLVFNCPHVWIFSNEHPDITKLSKDRWKIWTIEDNQLIEYINENALLL